MFWTLQGGEDNRYDIEGNVNQTFPALKLD